MSRPLGRHVETAEECLIVDFARTRTAHDRDESPLEI